MKTKNETYEDLLKLLRERNDFINSRFIIGIMPEIKNSTNLRKMINTIRIKGVPVISSNRGYKISNNKLEVLNTIHQLHHRANSIFKAANGMMKSFI